MLIQIITQAKSFLQNNKKNILINNHFLIFKNLKIAEIKSFR